jgi:hypothetical protein
VRIIPSSGLFANTLLSRLEKSKKSLPPMFLSYNCICRTRSFLPYRLYPVYIFLAIIA